MANSTNNVVTHGLSGTVGGMLVFRQYGDKTIVARRPAKRTSPLKESEIENKERFKEAAAYAKGVIKVPQLKEMYQAVAKPRQTAYNVAFADYFIAPEIREVDHSNYVGIAGNKIRIRAIDDFKVLAVTIEIIGADLNVLENGNAVISENELDWIYTVKQANNTLPGTKIIASASDHAGNATISEIVL